MVSKLKDMTIIEMHDVFFCDEHNHIGQMPIEQAEKELKRVNDYTHLKDKFKIIYCKHFFETSMFENNKCIETDKGYVWIVGK